MTRGFLAISISQEDKNRIEEYLKKKIPRIPASAFSVRQKSGI